ncbi:MAG: hypothetical protein ACLUUO_02765 [Sellimonas intestinalis]
MRCRGYDADYECEISILTVWVGAHGLWMSGQMQVGDMMAFIRRYTMQIIMAFLMDSARSLLCFQELPLQPDDSG